MNDPAFSEWLKTHKSHFEGYSSDEIAYRAHLAGFSWPVIFQTLPEWIMNRKMNCKYTDREWFFVQRELDYLNPLKSHWERLHRHQIGLED